MKVGKKKQDDIEDKIDSLFKQNLELISQNKTILAEINNKAEYTKTLEQLFMFILEVIMKKNDGTPAGNAFTSFKSNLEGISTIFDKTKDMFNSESRDNNNLVSSVPNFKSNYPMLEGNKVNSDDSKFLSSVTASPRGGFQLISSIDRPATPNHMSNFDFFENDIKPSRKTSTTSMPRLLIDDYVNVTSSPKTMSNYDLKHVTHSNLLNTPKSEI